MIKSLNHRYFICSVIACFLVLIVSPFTNCSLAMDQTEIQAIIHNLKEPEPDNDVRRRIEETLKKVDPESVQAFIKLLENDEKEVRWAAAHALAMVGSGAKEAAPALIKALKNDKEHYVREKAAWALGRIGPEAKEAVPVLIKKLEDDDDPRVRENAAWALSTISKNKSEKVAPALIKALKNDKKRNVREEAAWALGQFDPAPKAAVPALTKVLNNKDEDVRYWAAFALEKLSDRFVDEKATDMIKDLEAAEKALSDYPHLEELNKKITEYIKRLQGIKPWWEKLWHWINKNKINKAIGISSVLCILWTIVLLNVFWLRPLAFLRINQVLRSLEIDLKFVKLSLRFLLLVSLFNYRPRVLDAYVKKHIPLSRKNFEEKATVDDRRIHISLPVKFSRGSVRKAVPNLTSKLLCPTFARQINCLLIWGEGGSGKTSLACQIAKWAMAEDKAERLCAHLLLPVLLENELEKKEDRSALLEAVGRELQLLTDQADPIPAELLERLLRQRRVLVIVDHLSEMSKATREQIKPATHDFPANALIVTSRLKEKLGGVTKTLVKPMRIKRGRLSPFIETYLMHRGKSSLFTDSEIQDARRCLTDMVGERDITAMLAKLYVDQMIACKEGFTDDKLPTNIPDLMLAYLNELNRNVPKEKENWMEDPTVHQTTKILAWESLKETFRPASVRIDHAITALGDETTKGHLDYIENSLCLIKTERTAKDRFKFLLDPLAEYLAGLHILELYGKNEKAWRQFLADADQKEGAPAAISGFLLAVRDCCLAKAKEANTPVFVVDELAKRAGLDPELLKQAQLNQRIKRLIQQLDFPLAEDRLSAANDLGKIGSEARAAVPALIEALEDISEGVREGAAEALGNIGSEARAAVPALIEILNDKDENKHVREGTAEALGKIGPGAREVMSVLIKVFKDKDEDKNVREGAAEALGNIGSEARAAVPALIEILNDKDENKYARWWAVWILGEIGPEAKAAVPPLVEALKDISESIRYKAVGALVHIGPEAVPALIEALKDEDRDVKKLAGNTLRKIGPEAKEAVPALIEALKDEGGWVRNSAAKALEKINTPEAQKALADYKKQSD